MASTIVRVIYQGVTYDLDLLDDLPLRLDVSAVEAGRLGDFFGVGSQSFTLPGTKNNNKFFKHAYDVGIEEVPGFYNSITGYIIHNGETQLRGQFVLQQILKDEEGFVSYECEITDNVVQLKDNLANRFVSNADWSAYNHTITSASIIQSWEGNLLSGSVFYPVAEYGDEDKDISLTRIGYSNGVGTGWFDNPATPLNTQQLIPAVRARDTLEVILDQVGFRATGSFFESPDFEDVYILPKAQEGVGFVTEDGATATFFADVLTTPAYPVPFSYTLNNATPVNIKFPNESTDPQNAYTVPDYYTMNDIGNYVIDAYLGFFNPLIYSTATTTMVFEMVQGDYATLTGTVIDTQEQVVNSQFGFNTVVINVGANIYNNAPGTDVWVQYYNKDTQGTIPSTVTFQPYSGYYRCSQAPASYEGATVNMALQFPSDLRSIEIVQGLIQQFNLVLTPDYNQENTINVQTFDDWMVSGRNVDWTQKFETAKRVAVTHTVDEVEREIIYGNTTDVDRFSKETTENEPGDQYGTLRLVADNNISQGKRSVINYFAPTILASSFLSGSVDNDGNPTWNLDLNSRTVVPHLYKLENNRLNSFKFKPRIGYKVSNTQPAGRSFYFGDPGSATEITGTYTTLGNVNSLPVVADQTNDLHFNNTYGLFTGGNLNLNAGVNNYEYYWKLLTDSLYWDANRKLTLDIEFEAHEYKDIRLNDHIFIKNQQYRINKISGYNVSGKDVVTVELLRLYPAYIRPINVADCAFTVSGSYSSTACAPAPVAPQPVPAPIAIPVPQAGLTNGWAFTAGTLTEFGTTNTGLHIGTRPEGFTFFGSPLTPTTTTETIPDYTIPFFGGGQLNIDGGEAIVGLGNVSGYGLSQFTVENGNLITSLINVPVDGDGPTLPLTLTGTITDGVFTGNWSATYVDTTGGELNGQPYNPEVVASNNLQGSSTSLTGISLVNGTNYQITVTSIT